MRAGTKEGVCHGIVVPKRKTSPVVPGDSETCHLERLSRWMTRTCTCTQEAVGHDDDTLRAQVRVCIYNPIKPHAQSDSGGRVTSRRTNAIVPSCPEPPNARKQQQKQYPAAQPDDITRGYPSHPNLLVYPPTPNRLPKRAANSASKPPALFKPERFQDSQSLSPLIEKPTPPLPIPIPVLTTLYSLQSSKSRHHR